MLVAQCRAHLVAHRSTRIRIWDAVWSVHSSDVVDSRERCTFNRWQKRVMLSSSSYKTSSSQKYHSTPSPPSPWLSLRRCPSTSCLTLRVTRTLSGCSQLRAPHLYPTSVPPDGGMISAKPSSITSSAIVMSTSTSTANTSRACSSTTHVRTLAGPPLLPCTLVFATPMFSSLATRTFLSRLSSGMSPTLRPATKGRAS